MRGVLFLTESFHPVLGGGEQHIRTLSARLAASGMPSTVLTRRTGADWPAEELLEGVRVLRVPPSGPGRSGKYRMVPAALATLWRERAGFDLIVVRGTRVLGLPGLVWGRLLGVPVILQPELNGELAGDVYTWGTPLDRPLGRSAMRGATTLRNLWLRDADAFVAMSREIAREFAVAGVPEEKIALIPHGVDTRRFRPATVAEKAAARQRLGLASDALLVTYTGRLLAGKGLETLIAAFATLAASYTDAHLLLVGSGEGQVLSVEDDLRRRVVGAGLERRVTFTGRIDAVEDCLWASDIFVFPSLFEALGLSLVEAAACGLPSVGSRTGGIVDVIDDGVSGRLVTPGSADEIAAALRPLLADAELRARYGAQARARAVARFDLEESVDRYRALFLETCRARGSG